MRRRGKRPPEVGIIADVVVDDEGTVWRLRLKTQGPAPARLRKEFDAAKATLKRVKG